MLLALQSAARCTVSKMSPSTKDVVVKFISLSFRTAIRCLELSATLSLLSEPLYIDDGVDARGFNGLV